MILLHTGQTACHKRFNSGPIVPFGAEIHHTPISQKDKQRPNQFGKKMLPSICMDRALRVGGCTGDWLIADWEDIEYLPATGVHVKRFKSQEVGIITVPRKHMFPCAGGVAGNFKKKALKARATWKQATKSHQQLVLSTEDEDDFWSMSGEKIYRHHVAPRESTTRSSRIIVPNFSSVHRRAQAN